MQLRVYTIYNYLDVEVKDDIDVSILINQLEEGNTIMLEKKDGNIFILNNLNVLAIEKIESPPIN